MRRLAITGTALTVLVSGGVAHATTEPPDTLPTTEESVDAETTVAEEPVGTGAAAADTAAAGDDVPAIVYDESGDPVATITVIGTELQWTDYAEGAEPDEGNEYVRVTVDVASTVTENTFGVSTGDFLLQDEHGFVINAETVASAAQVEAEEDVVGDADLANGESIELALTFQVGADVGPQSVFYRPDDDRLIDIAEIG
jgi:hypothetical protein